MQKKSFQSDHSAAPQVCKREWKRVLQSASVQKCFPLFLMAFRTRRNALLRSYRNFFFPFFPFVHQWHCCLDRIEKCVPYCFQCLTTRIIFSYSICFDCLKKKGQWAPSIGCKREKTGTGWRAEVRVPGEFVDNDAIIVKLQRDIGYFLLYTWPRCLVCGARNINSKVTLNFIDLKWPQNLQVLTSRNNKAWRGEKC